MSETVKAMRTVQGRVISAKAQNSVTVAVERLVPHPLYGKFVRKTTKLHAHDQEGQAAEGDLVELRASRPVSKSKSWQVLRVIEKAAG